jgi:S-adenosylmethionine:tRNA ribosyltransferase-isomerase
MPHFDQFDSYDFTLSEERIAQRPLPRRRDARLLIWEREGKFCDGAIRDLPRLLRPSDLLVLNDTKVFPARLYGRKKRGGARVEVLLTDPLADESWSALVRPGRRLPPGTEIELEGGPEMMIEEALGRGLRRVRLTGGASALDYAVHHGHVPLPPYIRRSDDERDTERYQTIFARERGSVAAPTAGLHFDAELLDELRRKGVACAFVTLHVGPGTFLPLSEEELKRGSLHAERFTVPSETVRAILECKRWGGRVVAVGTTACRSLESLPADATEGVSGTTSLFIRPGHRFRWVNVLLTNFHLPRSSLLILVAAFAGERWREAYAHALREGYRFYSYGDANWIERSHPQ